MAHKYKGCVQSEKAVWQQSGKNSFLQHQYNQYHYKKMWKIPLKGIKENIFFSGRNNGKNSWLLQGEMHQSSSNYRKYCENLKKWSELSIKWDIKPDGEFTTWIMLAYLIHFSRSSLTNLGLGFSRSKVKQSDLYRGETIVPSTVQVFFFLII